jgi:polar amino acid transport system substrate-binding protein
MGAAMADVLRDLAPEGRIRAAINFGNPVLAHQDPRTGQPQGVSVDLIHELGRRLGVSVELITFDAARKVFEAMKMKRSAWDVAFLAIDPVRAAEIAFTAPYVLIEGTYIVRDESPLQSIDEFDRPEVRIAVGKGAAYDLFLTRSLQHAQILRADTSPEAIELFVNRELEAAAGVRQPLTDFARGHAGFRVIEGCFTAIQQAMGTPRHRTAGSAYLAGFVEEMKAGNFIAPALARSGQHATLAPLA